MQAITYSEARQNLASTMTRVVENIEPIIITRNRGESCVLMSLAEFESLQETAYLLRNPINAQKLTQSVAQLRTGKGKKRELIDE